MGLLSGHRIDLSGLTAGEARSLVLAAAGAPGQEGVDAALRKVLAALPAPLRDQVTAARESIHIDGTGWSRRPDLERSEDKDRRSGVILGRLRQSLDRGVQVDLSYAGPGQGRRGGGCIHAAWWSSGAPGIWSRPRRPGCGPTGCRGSRRSSPPTSRPRSRALQPASHLASVAAGPRGATATGRRDCRVLRRAASVAPPVRWARRLVGPDRPRR